MSTHQTAGASRCADIGTQQTCMMQNGCLQWVKAACSSAQICMDPGDGSDPKCVVGVPCTCPSGFSCSEIRTNVGLGYNELAGAYCIKTGTAFTGANTCGTVEGHWDNRCAGSPGASGGK